MATLEELSLLQDQLKELRNKEKELRKEIEKVRKEFVMAEHQYIDENAKYFPFDEKTFFFRLGTSNRKIKTLFPYKMYDGKIVYSVTLYDGLTFDVYEQDIIAK